MLLSGRWQQPEKQQLKDSMCAVLHFLGTKSPGMGRKGNIKVFLPIFINVGKAEDSLNSVVESPRASTVMTESLLPYTIWE